MSNTLTPQLADLAIRFMARAQLSGEEASTYVMVREALESVVNQTNEAPPWDVPKAVDEQPDLAEK